MLDHDREREIREGEEKNSTTVNKRQGVCVDGAGALCPPNSPPACLTPLTTVPSTSKCDAGAVQVQGGEIPCGGMAAPTSTHPVAAAGHRP